MKCWREDRRLCKQQQQQQQHQHGDPCLSDAVVSIHLLMQLNAQLLHNYYNDNEFTAHNMLIII